jgi:hypothetical protein
MPEGRPQPGTLTVADKRDGAVGLRPSSMASRRPYSGLTGAMGPGASAPWIEFGRRSHPPLLDP